MLVGNILVRVSGPKCGMTAAIYVAIGLFHYIFRKPFLEISLNPDADAARGISVRFWDFLFYASFGLVVTSLGRDRGRPARLLLPHRAVGRRHALRRGASAQRLAIGWVMGMVVSMLGMYLRSVQFDLPTGATIVCTFGLVLIADGSSAKPLYEGDG